MSIALNSFGQFASTPCSSGALTTSCAANTVSLTSSFTNSGITDPTSENGGVGCSSVGSDQTAGTLGNSGGSQDYDGWFTTTADASGIVDVYAAIISGDPVIGLYSGPCSSPTLLTCDDDGGTGLDAYINQTGLTPGGTYYIRIWDYNGGTGTYEVTTNGGTPPANDDCSSATGLTVNGSAISGTNYCATVETSDWDDCEANTENNVWYSFTTSSDGDITVNFTAVDCFGSGAGVDVSVFYGNCSSFSSYGCTSIASSSSGSITQFTGPAGTYYVMVDGDNSGGATALCDFDIDVDFVGCTADAGTNTSPALINNCAGGDVTTVSATGTVNTYLGSDPCIGWGYWVESDPLGVFAGMSGIGSLPSGGNPAGGGDANYAGVWTSIDYPLANGETPTLPDEANGVTYYIAPVTLSNCQTGEINSTCFDIGAVTELYFNPEITYTSVIDCDNAGTPTTLVAIAIGGGLPSVDGSNFTLSNTGDGTLSSTSVADGGTVTVTDVPDGGTVSITVTDGVGCTETITIGPIDASAYCPTCGADAGTYTSDLNSVSTTSPVIMCFGDVLELIHNGDYVLPPDLNLCGDPPGPSTFNGSTAGTCNPGIVWGIFTGLATTANPFDDPAFSTFGFVGEDQTFVNNGNLITALLVNSIPISNNTFYLYPVTADVTDIDIDGDGNLDWNEDINSDGCLDSGTPIAITMLNELRATASDGCLGPKITIIGGYPEFFPGNYTITNNGSGTITGTPVSHGETIIITGLNNGDPYDITITDGNGCSLNLTGTYNYTQPTLSIDNLATEFCLGDAVDPFTTSPSPVTVTSGTFDLDVTSDGYSSELSFEIFDALGNSVWTYDLTTDYTAGTNAPTITTSSLTAGDGPFTLVVSDSYGDGESFDPSGQTVITNNVTGAVVGTTSGNWGSSISVNLYDFYSFTSSLSGTGVTDNGDGTGSFNPNIEGTHDVVFTYSSSEGCDYYDTIQVTVHQVPLLGSTIDPSICASETLLLSDYSPGEANGVAGTGTWYTDAVFTTTASTSAFTPTNGQQFYYQYVTTAGSCTDDASITVTVNPNPTASAGSDIVIDCNSTSGQETLDGSGSSAGMTYSWSTGTGNIVSGTSTTIPTVDAAGTYTITVTNTTTGCSATDDVVVTEDLTAPTASAGTDVVINCNSAGGQETLDGSGSTTGMTYSWSTGTGNIVSGGSTTTPTVDAAGTYTITVTDASNGCSATDDVIVTEDANIPTASAGTDVIIDCNSASGQESLDGSGSTTGMTYSWSTGTGNIVSGGSTTTPTVDAAGTYTITVTNTSNGCFATDDVVVTEDLTAPTADAGADVVIDCNSAGGQEALDGSASTTGMTYVWSTAGAGNIVSGGSTITPTVDAAGTYTITVTDASNGCSATDDVVVTEDLAVPTADAGSDFTTTCTTPTATLSGSASGGSSPYSYSWDNSIGAVQNPTVDPATTTTYTLTVTGANGCTDTDDVTVTVDETLPTIDPVGDDSGCNGDMLGGYSFSGTPASGVTYSWTNSNTSIGLSGSGSGNISAFAATNSGSGPITGTITITAEITASGCQATSTFDITVNPVPVLAATTDPEVCANANSINLSSYTPAVTNGVAGTGQWYTGTDNSGTPVSGTQAGLSDGDQFYYEFTATAGSCTADAMITVTVNPVPVLSAVSNPSVCADANSIDLSAITPSETAGVAGTGQWYTGTNNTGTPVSGVQTVSNGDQFFYEYTSSVGSCTDDVTISVTVNPMPVLSNVTNPSVCADANSIDLSTLTPTETAGVPGSGQWYTGTDNTGTPVSGVQSGLSDGDQFYYEYTSTAGGCTDGHLLTVTVNPLPVLSAVANPEVCADANTINLTSLTPSETAGVIGSGQWYAGTSNADPAVSGVQTVSDGDQFYYEYTSSAGSCTDDLTITVTVNPLPTATDQSAPGVCEDNQGSGTVAGIDLTSFESSINGGAGVTYNWFSDAGLTSSVGTPSSVTVSNGDIYYAQVVDGTTGCTDVAQVDFTVYAIPTTNDITPSICEDVLGSGQTSGVNLTGNNSSINSGGGITFTWYTDAGLTSPVGSPSSTTVNNNDIFYVEVDNGNCTDVAIVTYSVTSTITLTDPNPQLCEDVLGGGTYAGYDLTSINGSIYSGSGSTTYTWYQSDMTTAVSTPTNITLSDGDQYYVDVADGNCSNAIMVNFNVNSLPTVTGVSDIEQCDEGSNMATFDLTSVQSGVNATGPTYNWFSDSGLTTNIGTPGSYSSSSSTVYVQVVDANGCQNDIGVNLVVNPLPTATATSIEECNTGSNQATFDLTAVESTVDGGAGNTINWYSDAILATPISTPSTYQTVSTTVYAEVTDGNSCSNSVGVTLTVNPLPTATDQTPAGICEDTPGGGTATIDLTSYESGINGGAGFTINWFSDASLTTSVTTPSTEAASNGSVYYAQVIDNTTLCENTAEVTITVFSAPSATDITPSLCEDVLGSGQTSGVDLTANNVSINNNAGLSFTWYTDAALTTTVSSPTSTTINNGDQFFVEVSNGNCTSVAQVDYTVTSTITLNDPAPEMCESSQGSLQFTGYDLTSLNTSVYAGGGSTTYTWYESDMVTVVAGANNIILNNADQYYLEVVDGNCSNTIMITFTVNPLPTATDQTPTGICEDTPGSGIATVDLTSYESSINGGAAITINWFSDAGLTTPVTTPTAEGAADGNTYYAQVIDNTTLCEDTAQLTITVFSAPVATDITPSTCEDVLGSSQATGVDLTANNGSINGGSGLTFTWYTDAALTTAESSPTSATVNNGDIFYVEVSNGNCTSVAQVDYAVTSTISLTDPLPEMCETTEGSSQTTGYDLTSINSSVYSGSGSTVYTWYESDMITTVSTPTSVDVSNGDQYYIEVADGNCSNAIMITFTVNPIPSMTPVTALELCDDGTGQGTFDLTAQEGNINATGPTYNWYSDAGLTTAISTPSAYSTATTTAYLEVTDANGCSNSYGLDVTVNPLPSANTTSSDICDDGTGQATFDLTSMESTVDGGAGNTINWFSDAGLTTAIGTPATYTTSTTTVYAEVTDATTGCTNAAVVDLNVTASPSAPILSSNSSYCEGENISDLTANGGGGTITWYDDASLSNAVGTGSTFTPTLSGTGSTTYYVVEDLGGCISEMDSVTVTINSNPVANFTASATNGNIPLDVDFTDASTGNGLSYSWEFGDNNTSNQQNPSNTFDELGSFTTVLTVTDNNGCTDTTSAVITVAGESVLIIPNIFSPNGDGLNDTWNVEGTNITEIQGTIMNRWGQVMFMFDLLEMGWDGRTVSGVEASEGTYYYIIEAVGQDGTVYNYQGPFELVR